MKALFFGSVLKPQPATPNWSPAPPGGLWNVNVVVKGFMVVAVVLTMLNVVVNAPSVVAYSR